MKKNHGTASLDAKQFAELAAAVIRQLPRDMEPATAQRWIESQGELQNTLRSALTLSATHPAAKTKAEKPPAPRPTVTSFQVVVDYGRSLEEMVKAGKYDWVDDDIAQKSFPHDQALGRVEITLELVHFKKRISSDNVIAELEKLGLRPATLPELLAFGEMNPDEQRKFPIVGLGSVGTNPEDRDRGDVPYLSGDGAHRSLGLFWWDVSGWYGHYRFLGVRK